MGMQVISTVRHGLILGIVALMMGALWAVYMATNHETLHGAFEQQQEVIQQQQAQKMMKDMTMDAMGEAEMGHTHGSEMSANHHESAPDMHQEGGGHAHGANQQHSHSGSLAKDAMQRLLRGHIHAMGLGVLVCVLLLIVAFTSLKDVWKKVFGLTFGLGAVLYPPAWVIMGFRTVELGPEAAEASIMWLFGPAVALLIGSMVALLGVLLLEQLGLKDKALFSWAFD
ncbi:hypothetical protein [Ghiorsea bivora]|uniref:hypothetical protein n=1 Tax=Ghiorsea bivora TaxID=1485545 RepID=UPI00056F7FE5|nr:hypothetical protein [Ghiorsea bivora]